MTEGVELLYSSTTMVTLRKYSRIAAADMVAPGGAKRNPGKGNARRSPIRGSVMKNELVWDRTEGTYVEN